jgi:hypothetical protein
VVVFVLSTIMVYLRTVFRLAETAEGLFGKLATHEVFFWVFGVCAYCVGGIFAGGSGIREGVWVEGEGESSQALDTLTTSLKISYHAVHTL